MQLSEAARALHADAPRQDVAFCGISTDTRTIEPGSLFFALQGPNFDGHDYIETARECGAAAAAVSHDCDSELPQVKVADTREALGWLAGYWRRRFSLPVVAITGSNGKTTVRSMTQAILSRCGNLLSTQGNLNNDIGLPLTLAGLDAEHEYAVLEMGANHPGEIAWLARVAAPTIGVVNNAGPAHLEGFGSLEGVARAKGELYEALGSDGIAVINADDRFAPLWRSMADGRTVISFGLDRKADVCATWKGDVSGSDLQLQTPQGSIDLRLPLPGRHNVMNALAATAVSLAAGATPADVRAGLESLQPVGGRFNIHRLPGERVVIDDTYNANPESLRAALEVLVQSPGETWLVLGDMGELGEGAASMHRDAGAAAKKLGVTRVFTLGELSREAALSFGEGAQAFADIDALLSALRGAGTSPLTVLVKGSRSMRMERVVDALKAGFAGSEEKQGRQH